MSVCSTSWVPETLEEPSVPAELISTLTVKSPDLMGVQVIIAPSICPLAFKVHPMSDGPVAAAVTNSKPVPDQRLNVNSFRKGSSVCAYRKNRHRQY